MFFICDFLIVLTAIASINQAIEHGNASELLTCLKHESAGLKNIEDDSVNRYLEQLVAVKKEKGQVGLAISCKCFTCVNSSMDHLLFIQCYHRRKSKLN